MNDECQKLNDSNDGMSEEERAMNETDERVDNDEQSIKMNTNEKKDKKEAVTKVIEDRIKPFNHISNSI